MSALQRWNHLVAEVNGKALIGTIGVRDVDNPCDAFDGGKPDKHGTCDTDGHYMCDECSERKTCPTGCGKRPMYCECRYCHACEQVGSDCNCATLGTDRIKQAVANYYGIDVVTLMGTSRKRAIAYPRAIAMYLCRHRLGVQVADAVVREVEAAVHREDAAMLNALEQIEQRIEAINV